MLILCLVLKQTTTQYQHEDNSELYSTYTPVYNQRRETYKPPAKYSFVWWVYKFVIDLLETKEPVYNNTYLMTHLLCLCLSSKRCDEIYCCIFTLPLFTRAGSILLKNKQEKLFVPRQKVHKKGQSNLSEAGNSKLKTLLMVNISLKSQLLI